MQLWEWILTFILIGPLILTTIVLSLSLADVGLKDLARYLNRLRTEEGPPFQRTPSPMSISTGTLRN